MKKHLQALLIAGVMLSGLLTGVSAAADEGSVHYLLPYQKYKLERFFGTDVEDNFSMMGQTYIQGLAGNEWSAYDRQAVFNLDEQFDSVSFLVGALDGNKNATGTLHIYADEELIQSVALSAGMMTTTIDLETTGVKQLRMDFIESDNSCAFGIANITGEGGHTYGDRTLTKSPTLTEEGIYTYHCTQCDAAYDEAIDSMEFCRPELLPYTVDHVDYFDQVDMDDYITVMGKNYYLGLFESGWSSGNRIAMYNLGAELKTVSFTVGHLDGYENKDGSLNIYFDNAQTPYMTIPLDITMLNQRVTLPVSGILQMKLEFVCDGSQGNYAIFDVDYERTVPKAHYYTSEIVAEATETVNGICTNTCVDCGFSYNEVILSEVNKTRAEQEAAEKAAAAAAEAEAVEADEAAAETEEVEANEAEAETEEVEADEAEAETGSAAASTIADKAKGYLNSILLLFDSGDMNTESYAALMVNASICLEQVNSPAGVLVNSALRVLSETPDEINSVRVLIESAIALL